MEKKNKIEEEAFRRYPDCTERNFGTGDYEWPECHAEDRELFIEGAEWMQKKMIDKACECIIKLHNWPTYYEEFAKFQEEFIKEFRKTMED